MGEYAKSIICPEHGVHNATLYISGHKLAGIWECNVMDLSDSCDHESFRTDIIETDPKNPVENSVYTYSVYICNDCECIMDGNPAEDAAGLLESLTLDCD